LKKIAVAALVGALTVVAIAGFLISTKIDIMAQLSLGRQPVRGVPGSSASAITSPPPSMEGINSHPEVIGTGADPSIVTLGPEEGGCQGCPPYPDKSSLDFELERGTPVLAPVDMVLVGFDNRNAVRRVRSDGEVQSPYDDLELVFESASPDWPGMVVCVYHLQSSPLLVGQDEGGSCGRVEEWRGTWQAEGHMFFERYEIVFRGIGGAGSCGALMGRTVRRGEVIGYAGSVGDHSMAAFRFKVPHAERNPTVRLGNRYLHWVQPDTFFYWMCYGSDVDFPDGVLAYPFPCEGYALPAEQYNVSFKYQPTGE